MRNILANWIWLLLFFALAFGFVIGGWSASKEIPPQQHAQRASATQYRAEVQSANVSESHAEQNQTKTGDKKEPHGDTVFGWISNFFEVKLTDLLIAIFTIVLAVKTSGLFKETAGLRVVAAEQSRDMKASIAAANRSADVAERALRDLERPWIFVFGVRVGDRETEAQGWFVEYTVANYGKMPAIIDAAYVGFEISEKAEPPIPLEVSGDHALVVSPILQGGERRTLKEYFPTQPDADVGATFRVLQSPKGDILEAVPNFKTDLGFDAFFRIIVYYRGPLSRDHETAANWLYSPPFDFLMRGGDEYNCNN